MIIQELKCDLLDVFENDDCTLLEKLISACQEFRACVTARVEKRLLYEEDCDNKKSVNATKISELQQKVDTVICNINTIMLEQEVIDKKVFNVIKLQENLTNELEEAKEQKDVLATERINLELEIEDRKKRKVLQWEAIKRACQIYKINLDIHISLREEEDCQYVKVTFFTHNEETKDKYFVRLLHNNNSWKVEYIEPKLKKEYVNELSIVEDSSGQSKVPDITLFLYQLRSIFLKNFITTEKKS